jgi:ribose/xylose/arabinose/galactoside ABC-type transport system permease subunit
LRLAIFSLAGCFSGLAGFIFMARTNSGDPSAGMNYELIAITAVVLGGANLSGGRAAIPGTLAGILCLGVLQNGLNLMAISTFYQTLFVGLVLVLASFLRRLGPNQ